MRFNKKIFKYKTNVVCTDGSTINIDFPYQKNDIYLTMDLKNNPFYLSSFNENIDTTRKLKQKGYEFDFYKLIQKKG